MKKSAVSQIVFVLAGTLLVNSCTCRCSSKLGETSEKGGVMFADDLTFLKEHTDVVVLRDGKAAVAVVPAYQGRVMTSTFDVDAGPSFGWLNRSVIEQGLLSEEERKGTLQDHIYVFGGEERFWMGPEGGQFAIFFEPGAKFDFDRWFTPACIDTEGYEIKSKSDKEVVFQHSAELRNWTGTEFKVGIERTVRLLDRSKVQENLGVELGDEIELVAYETENTIVNKGSEAWTKETGMLSIWILGMYPPSSGTTIVIPFKTGGEDELGPKVNDAYFGKVPADRLKVEDDILFFSGDGAHRAKIGVSPLRSRGVAGSYDAGAGVLNIVTYSEPGENGGYVNSMWEMQDNPFSGDVINAYNDGSPAPGQAPLGPFYELETSSPAADLKPGESLKHVQTTIHLRGPRDAVNSIAEKVLGAGLEKIESALK